MAQETLGLRGPWFSHGFTRTESGILTSHRSTARLPPLLHRYGNAPLPLTLACEDDASAGGLSPDHYRRNRAGLVSYYALFKGMAASKPTSQLSQHNHILCYTEPPLWGLSSRSGFFPSRRSTLAHRDCLPASIPWAFGVWLGEVLLTQPGPIQ
jgi:hypothetical protein